MASTRNGGLRAGRDLCGLGLGRQQPRERGEGESPDTAGDSRLPLLGGKAQEKYRQDYQIMRLEPAFWPELRFPQLPHHRPDTRLGTCGSARRNTRSPVSNQESEQSEVLNARKRADDRDEGMNLGPASKD